ncbi:MAG TPA: hypothetical protein VGQ57_16455, partial [Polyangiaceae bacterium]|nr:hypothetical protein [Polyangiaceae bacterium]
GGASGKGGTAGTGGTSGGGGSAGKGGSGGLGGASGKGGAGGSSGITCSSVTDGLALIIGPGTEAGSGWIDATQNCVGVQGAVYAIYDEVGSSATVTSTDNKVCASGTATKVLGGNFTDYWGVRLIIQLANSGTGTAGPYNASTHGVDGFKFSISGSTVPVEIRPTFFNTSSTTQYCERLCATGAQSLLLSHAHASCWSGDTGATPTGTSLQYLEFSIPSIATADVPFNFCVNSLTAIIDNVNVGNPGICPGGPDSCYGNCGTHASGGCWCDSLCTGNGDCCTDYSSECI